MGAPSWTGRPGFFYPSLAYDTELIEFTNPVHIPEPPTELAIRGQNVSLAGFQETLFVRDEVRIHLMFKVLSTVEVTALRTYYNAWGKYGRQAILTLDRFSTCAGQYEYDVFNTYFSRAELVTSPLAPTRLVVGDSIYMWDLVFRQGPEAV